MGNQSLAQILLIAFIIISWATFLIYHDKESENLKHIKEGKAVYRKISLELLGDLKKATEMCLYLSSELGEPDSERYLGLVEAYSKLEKMMQEVE